MNNFDKNIRKKLFNAEMPVSEGIWEAIESQIIVQKDNSRLWFFILLPLFLVPAFLLQNMDNKTDEPLEILASLDNLVFNSISPSTRNLDLNKNIATTSKLPILSQIKNPVNLNLELIESEKVINFNRLEVISSSEVILETNKFDEELTYAIPNFESNLPLVTKIEPLGANSMLSNINSTSSDIRARGFNFPKEETDCLSFEKQTPGLYAYAEYIGSAPFQSLSSRNAEFVEYTKSREETESGAYSFTSTVGLGYVFENGFLAESGLSYDQINMKFYYKDENASGNSTVITIDTMFTTNRDTIITSDTLVIENPFNQSVSGYNRFRQIDIPFVVGYQLPIGERLKLSLKGGVLINIRSSNSGHMLDLDHLPVSYGTSLSNQNEYFKRSIGFSYTGGINLEADINPYFSLYAGANIRYYPNNFSLPDNPVNQNYTKLGFSTGIKYRL